MVAFAEKHGLGADRAWRLRLGALTTSHVIGTLGMMSVLALAPLIQRDLAFSATQFGLLVAIYSGVQVVLSPWAGQLTDQIGVGRTLALAKALVGIGMLVVSRSQAFSAAATGIVVLGCGYAFINPATARGVLDWVPPHRRATGMGVK